MRSNREFHFSTQFHLTEFARLAGLTTLRLESVSVGTIRLVAHPAHYDLAVEAAEIIETALADCDYHAVDCGWGANETEASYYRRASTTHGHAFVWSKLNALQHRQIVAGVEADDRSHAPLKQLPAPRRMQRPGERFKRRAAR